MSTASARFGPKIAGWRSRSIHSPVSDMRACDAAAHLWEVELSAPHGYSFCKFSVLAIDEYQAREFASVRYPHDIGSIKVTDLGASCESQNYDTTMGVLRIETPEESTSRFDRFNETYGRTS